MIVSLFGSRNQAFGGHTLQDPKFAFKDSYGTKILSMLGWYPFDSTPYEDFLASVGDDTELPEISQK